MWISHPINHPKSCILLQCRQLVALKMRNHSDMNLAFSGVPVRLKVGGSNGGERSPQTYRERISPAEIVRNGKRICRCARMSGSCGVARSKGARFAYTPGLMAYYRVHTRQAHLKADRPGYVSLISRWSWPGCLGW